MRKKILLSVSVLCVFITGLLSGYIFAAPLGTLLRGKTVTVTISVPEEARSTPGPNVYPAVLDLIRTRYLQASVDETKLYYGSVKGMIQALDDPYSAFLDPEETKAETDDMNSRLVGIGMTLDFKDEKVVVIAIVEGAPANRAGIRSGDVIVAVDGRPIAGLKLNAVRRLIRGEAGTRVKLLVDRKESKEPKEFVLTREEIKRPTVNWKFRQVNRRKIAVISVNAFHLDTVALFQDALESCAKEGSDGLILDLRDNPGGLLEGAVKLAGAWVGTRPVIITLERGDLPESISSGREAILENMPTVVLVNGASASASEVLAGALQDYGVARVVGEQTFGKGVGQLTFNFNDGSSLRLVTFAWRTPNGRSIHKTGIKPDEIVKMTPEDREQKKDPQLDRAISILTGK